MKKSLGLLLLFVLASFYGCSGSDVDYAGTFEGQGLELVLRSDGEGFAGTIALKGQRYPATASRSGGGLAGTFTAGGDQHPFELDPSSDGLLLSSEGMSYSLRRRRAVNPLTSGAAQASKNPLLDPQSLGEAGTEPVDADVVRGVQEAQAQAAASLSGAATFSRTYKHPGGAYFMYPDGWTVRDAGDGSVALEPPDLAMVSGERAEALALSGQVADIKSVEDPQVEQFARQFMQNAITYMRPQGERQFVQLGPHRVFQLQWRGSYAGTEMAAAFQVLLLDGVAIGALTLAPVERFDGRFRTMCEVLRTVGYDKPKGDPRLIGSWRYTKTYMSGEFSSITERYLWLRADGTCYEGGRMMAGMSHTDSSGNATGASHVDAEGFDYKGRWHTEGATVVMQWDTGAVERWGFYVEGDSMLWKDGDTRKLWKRTG